ncbi:MAG: hypothetical protein K2X77_28755 [Candidatus Obscuribacterales bacterium]|jgi:hypothetical protein|nr:hypothetical protein [Candidatus Obscuribacterales bacterium]
MKFGKHQLLAAPAAGLLGLFCAGAAQADHFTFMTTTDGTPYMMETTPVVIERSVVTTPSTYIDTTPTVITHPVTIEPTVVETRPLVIRDRRDRSLLRFGLNPLLDLRLF